MQISTDLEHQRIKENRNQTQSVTSKPHIEPTDPFGFTNPTKSQELKPPQSLKEKLTKKSNRQRRRNNLDGKTKTQTFRNGGGKLRKQPTNTDLELKPT